MKLILLLPFMLFSFVFLVLDTNVVLAQENTAEEALPPAAILQDTTPHVSTLPLIPISTPNVKPRAPYKENYTEANWFYPGCTECKAMQMPGTINLGTSGRGAFRPENQRGKNQSPQKTGQ